MGFAIHQQIDKVVDNKYVKAIRPEYPETDLELKIQFKTEHSPFFFKPRRLSVGEKEAVKETTEDLLERKIIRPSDSLCGSPVVLVKNKCGKYRMAVDYREPNKNTVETSIPFLRQKIILTI